MILAVDLTGHVVPGDGYFVMGAAGGGSSVDLMLGSDSLSDHTQTLYLVAGADVAGLQALLGTDVDADGDLVTDIPDLAQVLDRIGLADQGYGNGVDVLHAGAEALVWEGALVPAGVFRGGDAPGFWCIRYLDNDDEFNTDLRRTPGLPNIDCPVAWPDLTASQVPWGVLSQSGHLDRPPGPSHGKPHGLLWSRTPHHDPRGPRGPHASGDRGSPVPGGVHDQ